MIALSALLMLSSVLQTRWALPVSIRARQDVPVENSQPLGYEVRGHLYTGPRYQAFVIRKGETLEMIAVGQEGGCRIRFRKQEYDVSSCPWLEGFSDHWTDIFEVVAKKE